MPRKLNMLPFAVPSPLRPAPVIFYLLSLDKRRAQCARFFWGSRSQSQARLDSGHPVIKHPLISCFYLHIHAAHSQLNWQPACLPAPRKFRLATCTTTTAATAAILLLIAS